MRILKILLPLCFLPVMTAAEPVITPTNFLDTTEPVRFCQDYIDAEYGDTVLAFVQPSGGALARIDMGTVTRCLYIFSDEALDRLLIFSLDDDGEDRTPRGIKAYGRRNNIANFEIPTGPVQPLSFSPPFDGMDSVGFFFTPVDVAVSSAGRLFDPDSDYVYVLDQGNMRVVRLRYDIPFDSLIWVDSFGPGTLDTPTAFDYADYGDTDRKNDDIYVADGLRSKIFRFSKDGDLEASYGVWGAGLGCIGYPTGLAVATADSLPNRFYITDSANHRVVSYLSTTGGPIIAEGWFVFPRDTDRYIKSVDTDEQGNVYVADNFTHNIFVLSPDLSSILLSYGGFGHDPGLFDHPYDLYIDNGEMEVCEFWGPESGIQSFSIEPGQPKVESDQLPTRFYLYQNYPNPFNSTTMIKFDLPRAGRARLVVYNIMGQLVAVPLDRDLPAGSHSIIWDGRNRAGNHVATGVYFYLLSADDNHRARKLLLLK
jgi:DNA-binding beta-propeller fold protein YncE